MFNLCYFRNTSTSSISSLVRYWVENSILAGVYSIRSGMKLQWITISYQVYKHVRNTAQVPSNISTVAESPYIFVYVYTPLYNKLTSVHKFYSNSNS